LFPRVRFMYEFFLEFGFIKNYIFYARIKPDFLSILILGLSGRFKPRFAS
jgi:hypothetical protein